MPHVQTEFYITPTGQVILAQLANGFIQNNSRRIHPMPTIIRQPLISLDIYCRWKLNRMHYCLRFSSIIPIFFCQSQIAPLTLRQVNEGRQLLRVAIERLNRAKKLRYFDILTRRPCFPFVSERATHVVTFDVIIS